MLTTQQLQTLKTAILADQALAALPVNDDTAFAIADAFNLPASPAFVAWRSSVPVEEIMSNGFVWTEVDGLSVGKARIWEWMADLGTINPSRANIRAGIDNAFQGAGAGPVAMRAAIYAHCKRNVTRAEKLYATGTGTDVSPATMGWEGSLTYQEVRQARGL
jgi:hypothetical protein